MAQIQVPVNVLDERCASCQCLELSKDALYADGENILNSYTCTNLHFCTFIRNRIVRNEKRNENGKDVISDG